MVREPRPISSILTELMVRRGFAQLRSAESLEVAWRAAAGEAFTRHTRVGSIRRGKLEVTVAHSTLAQELTFRKPAILATLRELLPDEVIRDLRIRVGPTI
jgi:predicted nucleic acid-binding Zn ribbon protein